jgi:antibiotic biosynthesis monooxygenase (ABM) superfamily enzyme
VHRPHTASDPWTLVYRFDTAAHLEGWLSSKERETWVARADAMAEDGHTHAAFTGMEPFFALPSSTTGAPAPPPKWKMALVTGCAVFPTAQLLGYACALVAPSAPPLARGAVVTTAMVESLTWVIMPRLTRALAPWLFARPA